MSQSREEKYPLLSLLLEDGKTHHEKEGRGVLWSEKGRYQDIGNGAATVITQWPGHLTNCWIGALIAALIFILVFIMTMASTARPDTAMLSMCKNRWDENGKHSSVAKVHLVHTSGRWHAKQLDVLKKIVESFPQNTVEVLLIQNRVRSLFPTSRKSTGQTTLALKGNNRANHTEEQEILSKMPTNAITIAKSGWSDALKVINKKYAILLKKLTSRKANETQRRIKTIDDFKSCYPNVNYIETTYEDAFKVTPFHYSWQHLNYKTRDFAIRVLHLWNYGGISFDLEQSESFDSILQQIIVFSSTRNRRVFSNNHFALLSSSSFEKLPEDVVIIDSQGRYMQTTAPCHVFFAEVLLKLKWANRHTEIKDILESTLRQFCQRGAVTQQYCDKLK